MLLAELFELVQGRILGLKSRTKKLLNDSHGDHVFGGDEFLRGIFDAVMEDRLLGDLTALKTCFVSHDGSQ